MQWEGGGKNKDPNALLWIIFIIAIVVGAMIYYFIIRDWLTSGVFVFMLLVLIWYLAVSPKKVHIAITDKGISTGNQFYEFQNLSGYWFSPRSEVMYFSGKNRVSMILAIPIDNQDVEKIKAVLPENILEIEDRGEDLVDKVVRILHL